MCRVMAILASSEGIFCVPGALLWHYGGALRRLNVGVML